MWRLRVDARNRHSFRRAAEVYFELSEPQSQPRAAGIGTVEQVRSLFPPRHAPYWELKYDRRHLS